MTKQVSGPTLLSKLILRFSVLSLLIPIVPASWLIWTKAVEVKV